MHGMLLLSPPINKHDQRHGHHQHRHDLHQHHHDHHRKYNQQSMNDTLLFSPPAIIIPMIIAGVKIMIFFTMMIILMKIINHENDAHAHIRKEGEC